MTEEGRGTDRAAGPGLGPPWFGRLPAEWTVKPLGYLARFSSGGTPDIGKLEYWHGEIPWVSPKDMKRELISDSEDHITELALRKAAVELLPPSTLLVVVRGMILAHTLPVAVTTANVTINQDIKALHCSPAIRPRFLQAVLQGQARWILSLADQSAHGTKKLETEVLKRFEVPCPPLEVQDQVVSFLDREMSSIDALVAAKQRVLDLLAEKRKAIVASAVTRGIDPQAKLRDSGVPWLGQIPAHWTAQRLKSHLHRIEQGWSPQCETVPAGPEDWGVLKAGCVNGDTFNPEENKRLPDRETPLPELEIHSADVLMSRANTTELLGSAALVREVRPRLLLCDKLYRLHVNTRVLLKEFLVYFLRTPSGRFDFERTATGASNSMQNISQDAVRNVWVPMPPLDEQQEIVDHIARETTRLDNVRTATERTIALLTERRAAVIAAAVTGQIDVGQAA